MKYLIFLCPICLLNNFLSFQLFVFSALWSSQPFELPSFLVSNLFGPPKMSLVLQPPVAWLLSLRTGIGGPTALSRSTRWFLLAVEFHFLTEESRNWKENCFFRALPKLPFTSPPPPPNPGKLVTFLMYRKELAFPNNLKRGFPGLFRDSSLYVEFSFVIPGTFHDTK